MSTPTPERTGSSRPDEWKDGQLTGPTGIPPEGQRHEDYFPPKWYQRKAVKVAGAVFGLLGAGAAVVGVTQGGGETGPKGPDSTTPSASANPTPGETTPSNPEVEPGNPLGVSAVENPTFQQAATAYYAQLEQFFQSGTPESEQAGDTQYLDALLGSDWSTNSEFGEYASDLQETAQTISTNHYATGENGDPEYESTLEVTEVTGVTESAEEVSGIVTLHATDNIMDTVLAMGASTGENLDSTNQYHLTFQNVDGQWQLKEVDNLSTPE